MSWPSRSCNHLQVTSPLESDTYMLLLPLLVCVPVVYRYNLGHGSSMIKYSFIHSAKVLPVGAVIALWCNRVVI